MSSNVFSNKRTVKAPAVFLKETSIKVNAPQQMNGFDLLNNIYNESIPLVFFDPQYRGILDKMKYSEKNDCFTSRTALPQMDTLTINKFILEIERILIPTGHLMFWIDKFTLLTDTLSYYLESSSLQIMDMITWTKNKWGLGYRTRRNSEYLLILQKKPYKVKGVWCRHDIPDVYHEGYSNEVYYTGHVHAKPILLQANLIEATTHLNDVVVDPTAGGYSVYHACQATGRRFLGCDIKFGTLQSHEYRTKTKGEKNEESKLCGVLPIEFLSN